MRLNICARKPDLLFLGLEKLRVNMSVSPPRPKGPPLNALRAFEAAARLGGFAHAASELCVTPGAISQHIKFLEEWAGSDLFERRSQGVSLTALGEDVAEKFSSAFDALGDAVHVLRTHADQSTINIAALPSIAQSWLSPRLPAIRAALKQQNISVTALEHPPNLSREMFDISVFLGRPKNATECVLGDDYLFPVCAPHIAKQMTSPADLFDQTWLYDATWQDDWATWTSAVIPGEPSLRQGPQFSLFSIALEEAKNGAGVLMGHSFLVEAMIKRGELVAPFNQSVPSGKSLILRDLCITLPH